MGCMVSSRLRGVQYIDGNGYRTDQVLFVITLKRCGGGIFSALTIDLLRNV